VRWLKNLRDWLALGYKPGTFTKNVDRLNEELNEDPPPPYIRKLVQLPGTSPSPLVVLHRTLNKVEHIRAVIVLIQWKQPDNAIAVDWSKVSTPALCEAQLTLAEETRRVLTGEHVND
jgi:hypothetical protein